MGGLHSFTKYTNRTKKLRDIRTIHGLTSYEMVGMIVTAIPHHLYVQFAYPEDCWALEDRYFVYWCLTQGITNFRICMDAEFNKTRHQEGGSGSLDRRRLMFGKGIARLSTDFPFMAGLTGTFSSPWKELMDYARGGEAKFYSVLEKGRPR